MLAAEEETRQKAQIGTKARRVETDCVAPDGGGALAAGQRKAREKPSPAADLKRRRL